MIRGGAVAILVAAALLAGCSPRAQPSGPAPDELTGTVTVLAAASLTEVFDSLGGAFEDEHPGVHLVLSYGGSAALAEQIASGVLADVFAAAEEAPMRGVEESGRAVAPQIFATNVLALAVPAGNPGGVSGLSDLARPELAVAVCDAAAPCGAASARLLERAGVEAQPDTLEADVKAVLTRIALGEADAGLVYATDVAAAGGKVEAVQVPEAVEVVNRYPIAALVDAPNPDAATAFVAYVRGREGRAALTEAGFGLP